MVEYEDWIFNELDEYQVRKRNDPFFISDWDGDQVTIHYPYELIGKIASTEEVDISEFGYKLPVEMKEFKIKLYNKTKLSQLGISPKSFSISSNATSALFSTLLALKKRKIKRYIVVRPAYYSIVDSLRDLSRVVMFYYLESKNEFKIDFNYLEDLIKSQYAEALIISNPVYSIGRELAESEIESLVAICRQNNITLVIDSAVEGLKWNSDRFDLFNHSILTTIKDLPSWVYVSSLPKAFFINDMKYSTIIGQPNLIAEIDDLTSQVSGGLNKLHLATIDSFLDQENYLELETCFKKNIEYAKGNYSQLESALLGSPLYLGNTDSGFFTMLLLKDRSYNHIKFMEISKRLLFNFDILAMTGNYFGFKREDDFGIRINLIKNFQPHIPSLLTCFEHYL